MSLDVPEETTRTRLLEATVATVARSGPRKLSLSDVASLAGVSRPTLYRYFASKEELLLALAAYEKERFEALLAEALDGLVGVARLDRAMRFIIEFQADSPHRGLVVVEPAFMLDQLARALGTMASSLVPMFEEVGPAVGGGAMTAADKADLVVRIALSHFLIQGDDDQLLRELRHAAGLDR